MDNKNFQTKEEAVGIEAYHKAPRYQQNLFPKELSKRALVLHFSKAYRLVGVACLAIGGETIR
jgi:hypothetical protein